MSSAIGYTRLSQESDTSIDRQKRHIRAYADENGLTLEAIFDDGERSSGFDESREEYQRVRKRVQSGEVAAVVVNDKRRLARDFDETMRLVLDLREHDIEAHTFQEGRLDLSDPVQAAVEVLQAASEHEAKKRKSSGPARPCRNALTTATTMDGLPSDFGLTTPARDGFPTARSASRTWSKPSGWLKTVQPTRTFRRNSGSRPPPCPA